MTGTQESDRDGTRLCGAGVSVPEVNDWFVNEVLPLEGALMQFLRHAWRNPGDIEDLCQDIYVRAYEGAAREIPKSARAFVFAIARNLLIDRIRTAQIVPIDSVADLDTLDIPGNQASAERSVIARQELRRLQGALDRMPPRCREAVILRKIEGLSIQDVAQRMGISPKTVDRHLSDGACFLADFVYGAESDSGSKR
jgi:RNA polymerase sigma factor (sigma-70 family)